ncbi:MAG TPA: hypothetical protein PLD27_04120 [bacterium]|nr:hypothetical protein [bacterium]HOL48065.1 hypothetical protein [bacterium]HPQ18000.1 hypothetical protein [bacterium]
MRIIFFISFFFIAYSFLIADNAFNFATYFFEPDFSSLNFSNFSYNTDNSLLFINPALLPEKVQNYFSANYISLFQRQKNQSIVLSIPIKSSYLSFGFQKNNIADTYYFSGFNKNEKINEYPDNIIYLISVGSRVYKKFFSGVSFKLLSSEQNSENKNNKIVFDVGVLYNLYNNFNFGVTVLNLGNPIKINSEEKEMPLMTSAGLNYFPHISNKIKVALFFSSTKIRNEKFFSSVGTKINFLKYYEINAGYNNRDENINFGFNFLYNDFKLKISRIKYFSYDDYYSFALSFSFGEEKRIKIEKFVKEKNPEIIRCLNCGKLFSSEYNYCPDCGFPVKGQIKILPK